MKKTDLPLDLRSGDFLKSMADPAYHLKDDQLQYHGCFFAFLDILGYKALMEKLGAQAPLEIFKIVRDAFLFHRSSYETVRVKILSDSILIWSASDSPINFWNVVNVVEQFVHSFQKKGIFLRGGVATGPNFIHEDIIVSPALVKAYELERRASLPRILVEEEALNIGVSNLKARSGTHVGILHEGYFRVCQPENFEYEDRMFVLSPFHLNANVRTLKTGLPGFYFPGDAVPTQEQILACKNDGIAALVEIRNGIILGRIETENPSVIQKFNYLAAKFNKLLSDLKVVEAVSEIPLQT